MLDELVKQPTVMEAFKTYAANRNGAIIAVNKKRLYNQPFILNTNSPLADVPVLSGQQSDTVGMRVSQEGPMVLTHLGAVQDDAHDNVLVQLIMNDGNNPIVLTRSWCHVRTLFGPGGLTYPLPQGLYLDESRALSATFREPDTDGDTLARISMAGMKYSKIYQDPELLRTRKKLESSQYESMPYFYPLDSQRVLIGAFTQVVREIQIDAAHNFLLHQIGRFTTGNFSINIIDMAKGESIINGPSGSNFEVPDQMLCGLDGASEGYPYRFKEPIMFYANQKIQVTMTNLTGAEIDVYLTFGGEAFAVRQWS
jgi:hypothetical protein